MTGNTNLEFMGKYFKGILGPFSGLVGAIVGVNWKGGFFLRSRPVKTNKPPTEPQLIQRKRFTMISRFLSPVTELLDIGFQAHQQERSTFNAAFTANKDAITGVYPLLVIDLPKVIIAKGKLLQPPASFEMTTLGAAAVEFSWSNNAPAQTTGGTDRLVLMAYAPDLEEYVTVINAAARSAGRFELSVPVHWSARIIHVWVFFVSVNGKINSNSLYVGAVTVV